MSYVPPIPVRFSVVAAELEVTYATDPVPTAASNAVRLASGMWSGIRPNARFLNDRDEVMTGTRQHLAAAPAHGQIAEITIGVEWKGLGAAYTAVTVAPDYDPLDQCCAWTPAWSSSPSDQLAYGPVFAGVPLPSCTIYGWGGGNEYKVSGCRGTWRLTIRPGGRMMKVYTLQGFLTALPAAAAVPSAPGFTTVIPPEAVAMSLSIGPWTPQFSEVVIEAGNRCEWLDSGNGTDGLQSYEIADIVPALTISGRSVAASTYDPFTDLVSTPPGSRALSITLGSVQYNRGTFSDSGLWIAQAPRHVNEKGFCAWSVDCRLLSPMMLLN